MGFRESAVLGKPPCQFPLLGVIPSDVPPRVISSAKQLLHRAILLSAAIAVLGAPALAQRMGPGSAGIAATSSSAPSSTTLAATAAAQAGTTLNSVQTSGSTDDSASSAVFQAFGVNNTAGNLIVVAVSWGDHPALSLSASDTVGNTYFVATNDFEPVNRQGLAILFAPNIRAGANIVTVNFGEADGYRRIIISEYSGIATSSPLDVAAQRQAPGTTATDGVTSGAASTTANGDLIFGVVMDDSGRFGTITAGTSFTTRTFVNNMDFAIEDAVQGAAGPVAATFTFSRADTYLAQMAAFRAAGAGTGGGGPIPSLLACNPATLVAGATTTCTVTLTQAAPPGGSTVSLLSSSTALSVPSSVTVPANSTLATFTATAGTVTTTQTVTVTATLGGVSTTTTVNVSAAALLSLAVTPGNASIALGAKQQYTATGTYTDGSTQNLTGSVSWSSSAAGVATISDTAGSQGLASSVGAGSTTITAASGTVTGSTILTVTAAPLQITSSSLPAGQVQVPYSATLDVIGGAPPRFWTVNGGLLPDGLSLASSTGVISGMPTLAGAFAFVIQVSDSAGATASSGCTININSVASPPNGATPFSVDPATAMKFGTHEVVLTGNAAVANPFDTVATVTFTPPSGANNAITVRAFYDGGNTWRARVYVTEAGTWQWTSSSGADSVLDGKSGSFTAVDSNLRGILKKDSLNPKAWRSDDGRWFVGLSDTAWLLFGPDPQVSQNWQQFVSDDAALGINVLGPVGSLESWGTGDVPHAGNNEPWADLGDGTTDLTRYDLAKFQNAESRLIWIFNNHPEMFIQSMLFGTQVQSGWSDLPQSVRNNTLDYMIARWSAFPNLFWLVSEDQDVTADATLAFNREVGNYFAAHEPWRHLMSTQPNRNQGFPFTTSDDLNWASYICIQVSDSTQAVQIQQYGFDSIPLQVMMGEDYYEQDYGDPPSGYSDSRFYHRWGMWSWILSGGSYNYGGRYGVIHPYTQTGRPDLVWIGPGGTDFTGYQLTGLDSLSYILSYFKDRNIDLSFFQPDDGLVISFAIKPGYSWHPKLMRRGVEEFIVYNPNASSEGQWSGVDPTTTASMTIDLRSAPGTVQVEWYRPFDGVVQSGGTVQGGALQDFVAPWQGYDVVLRLVSSSPAAAAIPGPAPRQSSAPR